MEFSLDALRHRHRNQIQTMTSLVSLFGRQMPEGPARTAFSDLRARFEAIGFVPDEPMTNGAGLDARLGALVETTREFLDPDGRRRFSAQIDTGGWEGRNATPLAQLVVELMIELYRQGLDAAEAGAGRLVIEPVEGGALRIAVAQTAPDAPRAPAPRPDPGRALADGLARGLGGRIVRETAGPLAAEVLISRESGR